MEIPPRDFDRRRLGSSSEAVASASSSSTPKAPTNVPSTEKWSVLSRRFTQGCVVPLKSGGNVALRKPFAVLRKRRVIRGILDPDANEPAKQEVELQPLHQLSLTAHPNPACAASAKAQDDKITSRFRRPETSSTAY